MQASEQNELEVTLPSVTNLPPQIDGLEESAEEIYGDFLYLYW